MEVALDDIIATAIHDDQFGGLANNGLEMPVGEEERVKDDLSRHLFKEHLDFERQDHRMTAITVSRGSGEVSG